MYFKMDSKTSFDPCGGRPTHTACASLTWFATGSLQLRCATPARDQGATVSKVFLAPLQSVCCNSRLLPLR